MLNFISRGPWQAALVVAFSSIHWFFSWLGGGILAYILLTRGMRAAISVYLLAAIPYLVMALQGNPSWLTSTFIFHYGWTLILVYSLKRFGTMNWTYNFAGVMSIIAVGLFYVLFPEFEARSMALLTQMLSDPNSPLNQWNLEPSIVEKIPQWQSMIGPLLMGFIVSMFLTHVLVSLFLGRYWQAKAAGVDGFKQEFLLLHLDKRLAVGALLFMSGAIASGQFLSLVPPLLFFTALPGICIVQYYLQQKHKMALCFFYLVLVFFLVYFLALLSLLAIIDSWIHFRTKKITKD